MKRIKSIILLSLIILISFPSYVHSISNNLDLLTEQVSEEQRNSIVSGTSISLLSNEKEKETIACFDVNEKGLVAIGFDTQPRARIHIYDINGNFLYGYEFNCEGSYGIGFVGDTITIFFVRGNYIESYDKNAKNIEVKRILTNVQNLDRLSSIIDRTQKIVGENHYHLERDIGLTMRSFSRLVLTDSQGEQHIIYDVSTKHNIRVVSIGILIMLFITIIVKVIYVKHRKRSST